MACTEADFSVTGEWSVTAAVASEVVVGTSGGTSTGSEGAGVCLSDGEVVSVDSPARLSPVGGPAGVSTFSGRPSIDVEEGSLSPPSSRLEVVTATLVFGASTTFEPSDSLDFLVPSLFSRVGSADGRSGIGVDGGNGAARLAGARRGTGGAPCGGTGEPVLEGGKGEEGRPDAGDPARERLSDIGEATDWGMGEPTRERGGETEAGGVCGWETVCEDIGHSEGIIVEVCSSCTLAGTSSLTPTTGAGSGVSTSSVGVANDSDDVCLSFCSRPTAVLSTATGSVLGTVLLAEHPALVSAVAPSGVVLRVSLRFGRAGGTWDVSREGCPWGWGTEGCDGGGDGSRLGALFSFSLSLSLRLSPPSFPQLTAISQSLRLRGGTGGFSDALGKVGWLLRGVDGGLSDPFPFIVILSALAELGSWVTSSCHIRSMMPERTKAHKEQVVRRRRRQ